MANREKIIRDSYYNQLNGNVTYNSVPIPISDLKLENPIASNIYILFGAQSAAYNPTFSYDAWNCLITVQIVCKQTSSVSRDILDLIGDQIEDLLGNGINLALGSFDDGFSNDFDTGSDYQLTTLYLNSVDYLRFEPTATSSPVVKNLEFHQLMIKL